MVTQETYEKKMFFISAVYNWSAAILFVALYYLNQELLGLFVKVPEGTIWFNLTFAVVFLFGVGYYWISKDVKRNRDIIKLGCVGKLVFFVLFYLYWKKGDVSGLAVSLVSGDLIFSILFAQVLFTLKNR